MVLIDTEDNSFGQWIGLLHVCREMLCNNPGTGSHCRRCFFYDRGVGYKTIFFITRYNLIIGLSLYFFSFSTFQAKPGLWLEDLFVLPEHRGHGVGKALLVKLAKVALERGCGRFEWSVLDWNEPAIGFYKRLGATLMDEWTICRVSGAALSKLAQKDI